MIQFLNEAKLSKGETYKLNSSLGLFSKDDEITIYNIKKTKNNIELYMKNQDGVKDVFYMDKSESFDDLN